MKTMRASSIPFSMSLTELVYQVLITGPFKYTFLVGWKGNGVRTEASKRCNFEHNMVAQIFEGKAWPAEPITDDEERII